MSLPPTEQIPGQASGSDLLSNIRASQSNGSPTIISLTPDIRSPQQAEATITWLAEASDPENDPILYRFFLNGKPVTDWMSQNQWSWTATDANAGDNQ
ncbi:MAG: hypothetical protein LUQ38_05400, partial [Methanotrichaceae archaeon]|nr:hypothetical protein [Methanotrichaceae archaeon]